MTNVDQSAKEHGRVLPLAADTARSDYLYIAGSGRNGSTLLGLHLGRSPDVCFAGELTHLWERGLLQNQLCGCGQPFRECEFWTAVLREAFGPMSDKDVTEIVRLRNQVSSLTGLVKLQIAHQHIDIDTANAYGQVYTTLAAAIRKTSGCRVVVDSSKYPTDLAALMQAGVSLYTIHLVRDCRAVVYSWRRKKRRTEIHWQPELMPRYGALQTTLAWRQFNSTIESLAAADDRRYRLLRYEDLMTDFDRELNRLTNWLGCDFPTADGTNNSTHSVSGNPCRFKFRAGDIRPDLEWQTQLSAFDRWIVRLFCRHQQRTYGY